MPAPPPPALTSSIPASLASLGRIEIIARWVVDGFLSGLHRSPKKGFSVEFAEFRPYQPGTTSGSSTGAWLPASDQWMVKQFEEETNTRAAIVLDVSRSMDWSGSPERLTKLRYAEQVVAAIALLLIRQRDAVGLVRYDDRLRTVLPARARTHAVAADHTRPRGDPGAGSDSRMAEGIQQARETHPPAWYRHRDLRPARRPDQMEQALRVARAAGHQVTVLHIMDPSEMELDARGEAIFYDPEGTLEVTATVSDVRQAYASHG